MKLADRFARENFTAAEEVKELLEKIQLHLSHQALDQTEFLSARSDHTLSPNELTHIFRNKEREENIHHILQYLLLFLTRVPWDGMASQNQVKPEKQMHEFIRYQVDLLLEKDIRKVIFHEYNQLKLLKAGNYWYYEGRIDDMHRELRSSLNENDRLQGATAILHLCQILEKLCLFWFDICREDAQRARTSDIFMYKLSKVVQIKLAEAQKS